jgi:hypothetical protein
MGDQHAPPEFSPIPFSCSPQSKPHIGDTAAVARQVIECVETIEVIDGKMSDRTGLGEPQVDGDASPALCIGPKAAPADHATAAAAKVKPEHGVGLVLARVDCARA